MINMRNWLKRNHLRRKVGLFCYRIIAPMSGFLIALMALPAYIRFLADWRLFRMAGGHATVLEIYPCLHDRATETAIDSHYFFQAIWAFKRILSSDPIFHVDVGSDVRFVGMLTTITNVIFVDIRPLQVNLENYEGEKGSILDLPYLDGSIQSLSCLHVIEHVGLGRYGDPIDPQGSLKAAIELQRVLAPGGRLYLSVPIGITRVQFNGQRIFSVSDVLTMFNRLRILELSIVNTDGKFTENISADNVILQDGHGNDYGLGMFLFAAPEI